jgi:serine/threonine-protein kinase
MLGGQPPFTGPSMPSIIRQHLVAEPRPIATLRPTVPAPVWAALERALAKNPADRFGLVSQFADALRPADPAAVSTMPVSTMPVSTTPLSTPALPTTTPPTASPRPHTERLLLTISVVLAVVLVLVVAFAVWQSTSR